MNRMRSALLLMLVSIGYSQENKFTGKVWIDAFGVPRHGVMFYPQYAWKVETTNHGSVSGYGFIESTPHERAFTNHLLVYTLPKIKWFSVHTESGAFPFHNLGFFQIGPRINLSEIPKIKKPFANLFVTALPSFIGIRPNNLLVAGATKELKIKKFSIWGEGYRRFVRHGPAYGEYWLLLKPYEKCPVAFGMIGHHVGDNSYPGFGLRLDLF